MLSYNVPVYRGNTFIGVVGIEIDYMTMKNEVDSIKLYKNGYAFINDAEGNIIYHPYIDVMMMSDDERPMVPNGLLSANQNIKYKFEGVEKQAVWLSLSNGMRLNVTVPMSEINSEWHKMIFITIILSVVLLVAFIFLTMRLTEHITKPLIELTDAAEQVDKGNYDVVLNYNENDEVGVLSRTFDRLIAHLRIYISDLNNLAHTDALTSVKNKSAYDIYVHKLQNKINHAEKSAEFAIVIFDCDDLKLINDRYGHDKGDLYLKNSSAMICHIFQHSPVFRIGGDEFAAILENDDYRERMSLVHLFEKRSEATCVSENKWWEQIRISVGMAVYDPNDDITVDDVARRADKLMYENKYNRKAKRNK